MTNYSPPSRFHVWNHPAGRTQCLHYFATKVTKRAARMADGMGGGRDVVVYGTGWDTNGRPRETTGCRQRSTSPRHGWPSSGFAAFDVRCELGDGLDTYSVLRQRATLVGRGQMDLSRAAVGQRSLKSWTTIIICSKVPNTLLHLSIVYR
jgi:hypothetical protein